MCLVEKITALTNTKDTLAAGAIIPPVSTLAGAVAGVSVFAQALNQSIIAIVDTLVRTVGDTLDTLSDIDGAAEVFELWEDFDDGIEALLDLITVLKVGNAA